MLQSTREEETPSQTSQSAAEIWERNGARQFWEGVLPNYFHARLWLGHFRMIQKRLRCRATRPVCRSVRLRDPTRRGPVPTETHTAIALYKLANHISRRSRSRDLLRKSHVFFDARQRDLFRKFVSIVVYAHVLVSN